MSPPETPMVAKLLRDYARDALQSDNRIRPRLIPRTRSASATRLLRMR
jgi:hypothetical protein